MEQHSLVKLIIDAWEIRKPKPKLGRTFTDINELLKGHTNNPAYLPQLHYAGQYDVSGYPQLRREFVDFLESGLDSKKSTEHLYSMTDIKLANQAMQVLIVYKPELWNVYREAVLCNRSINDLAEEFILREKHIIRMLQVARDVVSRAYVRAEENYKKTVGV